MWLDPGALAWSSWLGLAIGIIGGLISLVGLILTYREAKRATSAAAKASADVARAIELIQSRTRLAAISSAVSRADLLMSRIRKDALSSSPESLTEFRRLMKEAFARTEDTVGDELLDLTVLENNLERISRLVSSRGDLKVRREAMVEIFDGVMTQLISHESKARREITL